jgi:hypothetical protein
MVGGDQILPHLAALAGSSARPGDESGAWAGEQPARRSGGCENPLAAREYGERPCGAASAGETGNAEFLKEF